MCSQCDKAFILIGKLNQHMKTVHDLDLVANTKIKMTCNQCDKSLSSQGAFDYHMMVHSGEKGYTCSQCDKAFILAGQLKRHMKTVHDFGVVANTKINMVCNQCDKSFCSQNGFDYHMMVHNGERAHICNQCDKACILVGQLKDHIKTGHDLDLVTLTKLTKFCNQCDKSFSSQHGFDYHMMVHNGEKDYICSQCHKAFILAGQLKRHIQTVHKLDTPYQCNACNQEFSELHNLRAHTKRRHTENRPFKCKTCYKSLNLKERFISHTCKIDLGEAEKGEIHNTLEEGELCT